MVLNDSTLLTGRLTKCPLLTVSFLDKKKKRTIVPFSESLNKAELIENLLNCHKKITGSFEPCISF